MKKVLFLLALVIAICGQAQAQFMAVAENTNDFNISSELSMAATVDNSLYSPTLLNSNGVFGTNSTMDLQATQADPGFRKFAGVCLIWSGAGTLIAGGATIAYSLLFKDVSNGIIPDSDPSAQEGANFVSDVFMYVGIGAAVLGAGMLTGGIILVSSDGAKSGANATKYQTKNTRNTPASKKNKHKRVSAENLLAPEADNLGWSLAFSASPTMGALTLSF